MKVIKPVKDKVLSVRINSLFKNALAKDGFTVQEFLDKKLAEIYGLDIKVTRKKK
jgi:hypothetical protein